jgi:hypothetical protein
MWCTLVAIDECILDDHRPAICCCELLRLPSRLPEASRVLDLIVRAHTARHSQDMARKEFLRAAEVGVGCVGVFVARGKEDFGDWDK